MKVFLACLIASAVVGAAASCATGDDLDQGYNAVSGGSGPGGASGAAGSDGGGAAGASGGAAGASGGAAGASGAAGSGWVSQDSGPGDAPVIGIDAPSGGDSGDGAGPLVCNPPTANCDGNDANGCETTLTTLSDCGACNVACDVPHAAESCTTGVCSMGACDAGFADCDADQTNGCETDTQSSASNCGACNHQCQNQHGTTQCLAGQCVPSCSGLWDDCDSIPDNGCEQPTNTLTDCGGCSVPCNLPGGETCSSGSCQATGCPNNYDDCDGNASNNCEANLLDDVDNCGACGNACTNAHGSTSCQSGTCVYGCDAGWDSCDGNVQNGCETPLDTATDCGACEVVCDIPNAQSSCATGSCVLDGCPAGQSDCDGDEGTGCEFNHASAVNSCGTAADQGQKSGDKSCGFGCGGSSWSSFATVTGRTSQWFKARATECSICCADVEHGVTLAVPAGVNYDLYLYASCGSAIGQSTNGDGQTDSLIVFVGDGCFNEDSSFDYWVEVRYASGASCSEWSLTFDGKSCSC